MFPQDGSCLKMHIFTQNSLLQEQKRDTQLCWNFWVTRCW